MAGTQLAATGVIHRVSLHMATSLHRFRACWADEQGVVTQAPQLFPPAGVMIVVTNEHKSFEERLEVRPPLSHRSDRRLAVQVNDVAAAHHVVPHPADVRFVSRADAELLAQLFLSNDHGRTVCSFTPTSNLRSLSIDRSLLRVPRRCFEFVATEGIEQSTTEGNVGELLREKP